ncbi:MAG: hypothetical protein HQL30_10545 [Candidatus Omnitrophica bacterium]|nr:hypothetical protein [Candidatus Omnitrophota bacterium]
MRLIITVFTGSYLFFLGVVFIADREVSAGMYLFGTKGDTVLAGTLVDNAIRLSPYDSGNYYARYRILDKKIDMLTKGVNDPVNKDVRALREKQLRLLKRAIQLVPSDPLNHMQYALTVDRMLIYPNPIARGAILSEMGKAVSLKPYKRSYRRVYDAYLENFGKGKNETHADI